MKGGEYRALTNNCAQKMDSILNDAGVYGAQDSKSTALTPNGLYNKLQNMSIRDTVNSFLDKDYQPVVQSMRTEKIKKN